MLTKPEAERIAAAVNGLRPDWSINGILTVLADERLRLKRTYRDTCLAFTALALDPETVKPTRIFEHGPWWEATRISTNPTNNLPRIDPIGGCHECMRPRDDHTGADHEWQRPNPGIPMPNHVRQALNPTNQP